MKDLAKENRVDESFFQKPTLELAPSLLGTELVHETSSGVTAGMIVEVEAYRGPVDKAAHSYGGKMTDRTRAMYGPAGHAYIYFIYGMHFCLNVVSAGEGEPEGILIRAIQPTQGIPLMVQRRGLNVGKINTQSEAPLSLGKMKLLTNGPGKVCQAMGIAKEQYQANLAHSPLHLRHYQNPIPREMICTGPRINIDYAEEFKDNPWRFWIKDNPFVSK